MPDFMEGLSKGIERSRYMVANAMKHVAKDMVLSPSIASVEQGTQSTQRYDIGSQIREALANINVKSESTGDIVIPVYLGGTLLDEVIVNASQRSNLRRGGI